MDGNLSKTYKKGEKGTEEVALYKILLKSKYMYSMQTTTLAS